MAKREALKEAAAQAQAKRAELRAAKDRRQREAARTNGNEMEQITIGRVESSTPVMNPPAKVAAAESANVEHTEFPEAPKEEPKNSEQNGIPNGVSEANGVENGANEEKEPLLA